MSTSDLRVEAQLELSDLIWPDGSVQFIDAGFPITVSGQTLFIDEAKITLARIDDGSNGYALAVWSKGVGNGPVLEILERVVEIDELTPAARRLTLEVSGPVEYTKSRKCGCGSRLRSYRPWGSDVRSVSVPKPPLPWTA